MQNINSDANRCARGEHDNAMGGSGDDEKYDEEMRMMWMMTMMMSARRGVRRMKGTMTRSMTTTRKIGRP